MNFPHLFSPLEIRGKRLKNRIMSSGHDTSMPTDNLVNEPLVAYHRARARGGAGLIVMQVAGVHDSARYTSHVLMTTDDACIPGYRRVAEACHAEGCVVLSQIFHPGREIMESADGLLAVAYSASASPNERFRVMPRELDQPLIDEIVAGYAAAARRLHQAGLDGVEVVASHGYLPAQFLNPRVNRRTDGYNGDLDARLRFLREVLAAVRAATSEDFIVGLRLSADERDPEGLSESESLQAAEAVQGELDYLHIVAGTSASLGGAIHIVPPMAIEPAYLAREAGTFKARLAIPLFVTGRINQPQEAEAILARGQADVCGMTRALICDPQMPNKAEAGRSDDVRACIACNQACIGHFHRGYPISCIQHPETGRELTYATPNPASRRKRVLVAGGGPAGMKAAAVAAQRGHEVVLCEAGAQLGGQVNLAQLLPRRAEFGGASTNLQREMQLAGVEVRRNTPVDRALVERERPDLVIVATGAEPYWPPFERGGELQVVDAWQVLRGEVRVGRSVLVTDWRGDWIGPGIAEKLVREGHQVRLAVNGTHCGESLPLYVRDQLAGELHRLGIPVTPYARLYGCDDTTVYMQHSASGEAMLFEEVDTLVLCQGHQPVDRLADSLHGLAEVLRIGDCLAPPPHRRGGDLRRAQGRLEHLSGAAAAPSTGPGPAPRMPQTQPGPRRMPRPSPPDATDTPRSETHFLGTRIRGLRKRRGLTLAELAAQSELTAGYISQLERNLAYPSIPALFNIARSLGVTIQWFFASEAAVDPADAGYVVRRNTRMSVHYEDGIIDELLTPQPSRQLEILHSRFPPGTYSQQSYSHEGEEAGYILSGIFELWVGDRHFQLREGDSFSYSSQEPHRYGNPGDSDTLVLWVITPPTF